MGQNFCNACVHDCNGIGGEQQLTHQQGLQIINNDNQDINLNCNSKSKLSYLFSDINNKGNYTMFDQDTETQINSSFLISDFQNKLNKIITEYRLKLLISYFKKLLIMKQNSHKYIKYIKNMQEPQYKIEIEGSEDVNVDLFPEENYDYIGNIFNNKKDGFGKQIYKQSNSIYIGYFRNDYRINYCDFINKTKNYLYKGEVKKNNTGKYGIFYHNELNVSYEGEWLNNRKEGYGIEQYKDKSFYMGFFHLGKKKGIGYYKWNDNTVYMGYWENNFLDGYGIYHFQDGSSYSGSWKKNKMNGYGEFLFPGVKKYIGFFENDLKSGFGIIFWYKENKAFIGYWKENKQNGFGKYMNNGNIRYGFWENGIKKKKYDEDEFFIQLDEKMRRNQLFKLYYKELEQYLRKLEEM